MGDNAVAARLGSRQHKAKSRTLTVDTATRVITLGPGGWRLHGHATQVLYATRFADAAGAVAAGELAAPVDATMIASVAGTPSAGKAYGNGFAGTASDAEAGGSAVGVLELPTDTTDWREFAVPLGQYVNLYVRVAAGTASPKLSGPFEE